MTVYDTLFIPSHSRRWRIFQCNSSHFVSWCWIKSLEICVISSFFRLFCERFIFYFWWRSHEHRKKEKIFLSLVKQHNRFTVEQFTVFLFLYVSSCRRRRCREFAWIKKKRFPIGEWNWKFNWFELHLDKKCLTTIKFQLIYFPEIVQHTGLPNENSVISDFKTQTWNKMRKKNWMKENNNSSLILFTSIMLFLRSSRSSIQLVWLWYFMH